MKDIIKAVLKWPFSRKARRKLKAYRQEKKIAAQKLIMTLVVKNEEDIVEQNIRFHCAMGCDGFIVTSHNCTDNTNEILKKLKQEGLVLDIFYETSPNHQLNVWVSRMVDLARRKYHATWMINADADEFYYSKSLNLKESIYKCAGNFANVLWVDSNFLFPDDRDDYLSCPYFVTRPFLKFEADALGITNNPLYLEFIGSQGCTKVIHQTAGNPKPQKGNHTIVIDKPVAVEAADIKLFHYHIQNYAKYVAKVERWKEGIKYKPKGEGEHLKRMVVLYNEGKLREDYDAKYGISMREFLIEQGVVSLDPSVYNFLKYKKII